MTFPREWSTHITVVGVPVPQGSKRAFVVKSKDGSSKAVVSESGGTRHREWRQDVTAAVVDWIDTSGTTTPLDEPMAVDLDFRFPLPTSDPLRTRHSTVPDLDKLVRAVLDSLTSAGLVVDDSRFCEIHARKSYARNQPPGVVIRIARLGEEEAEWRALLRHRMGRTT